MKNHWLQWNYFLVVHVNTDYALYYILKRGNREFTLSPYQMNIDGKEASDDKTYEYVRNHLQLGSRLLVKPTAQYFLSAWDKKVKIYDVKIASYSPPPPSSPPP